MNPSEHEKSSGRVSVEPKRHLLSRWAAGDERLMVAPAGGPSELGALAAKDDALVQVSALIAIGAPQEVCQRAVRGALAAGATREDVVATLVAVSTIVGQSRVVAAAPAVALGIDDDVDSAVHD
jgi:alkylhydroperoxidase/carboxymuconolactone decarboxylase family protein YurZ